MVLLVCIILHCTDLLGTVSEPANTIFSRMCLGAVSQDSSFAKAQAGGRRSRMAGGAGGQEGGRGEIGGRGVQGVGGEGV